MSPVCKRPVDSVSVGAWTWYSERREQRPNLKQQTSTIATCVCYAGIDPFTKNPVAIANGMRDRKCSKLDAVL